MNRQVPTQAAPSEIDGIALPTALQPEIPPEPETGDDDVDLVVE